MKNISHKYPVLPWSQVKAAKAPAPIVGNVTAWFRREYNLQPGQRGTLTDYNGLQVIIDEGTIVRTRANRREYFNRLASAIEKPDEVWSEIDRDNLPALNYLKLYDDGLFKARVIFGVIEYIDLKPDLDWMDKQRSGFLCFARTVSDS